MGDPMNIVPYIDPHEDDTNNMILNFGGDLNPTLLDSSNHHPQFPGDSSSVFPELDDDSVAALIMADIGPFLDNNVVGEAAGPSGFHHPQENLSVPHHQNLSTAAISSPPDLPIPFSCTFCQVLREIVHSDGVLHFSKLQIHGKLGLISHAVLYQNTDVGSSSAHQPFQIFDFSDKSIKQIKAFLVRHCLNQNSMGYFMLQEPLSSYYEALSCGLDWAEDSNYDILSSDHKPDTSSGGKSGTEQDVKAEDDMERTSNTCPAEQGNAVQREGIEKMKLSDMRDLFGLPIQKAAKKLKLCPTEMKKICRKQGLQRWPHRKVRSIARQMSILRRALASEDGASTRSQTEAEIQRLQQEMVRHCGGFPPTSLNIE